MDIQPTPVDSAGCTSPRGVLGPGALAGMTPGTGLGCCSPVLGQSFLSCADGAVSGGQEMHYVRACAVQAWHSVSQVSAVLARVEMCDSGVFYTLRCQQYLMEMFRKNGKETKPIKASEL